MIVRAAIKVNGVVYIGAKGKRHDSVIHDIVNIHKLPSPVGGVQGFVDNKHKFLDRHEAAKHAFKCGQLPGDKECPDIIMSEDLW